MEGPELGFLWESREKDGLQRGEFLFRLWKITETLESWVPCPLSLLGEAGPGWGHVRLEKVLGHIQPPTSPLAPVPRVGPAELGRTKGECLRGGKLYILGQSRQLLLSPA